MIASKNFPSQSILAREVSKNAVNSFGCLQKLTWGLDQCMGTIERLFNEKMIQSPDSIILPHGCMQFFKLAKPENRIFALCGAMANRLEISKEREITTNVRIC